MTDRVLKTIVRNHLRKFRKRKKEKKKIQRYFHRYSFPEAN